MFDEILVLIQEVISCEPVLEVRFNTQIVKWHTYPFADSSGSTYRYPERRVLRYRLDR